MKRHFTRPSRSTPIRHARRMGTAFSLIELLVVVAVLGILTSVMAPRLIGARRQAQSTVCASNIRQLVQAVSMYGMENAGRACPGAAGFLKNLNRWHGARDNVSQPFNSARGPLFDYLGSERRIRDCPTFRRFTADPLTAFERGCGGYGYNSDFIGRELRRLTPALYQVVSDRAGAMLDRIRRPAETIMFADAAFSNAALIEYSFATPRFQPTNGARGVPSIHFRHRGFANVAWADAHVDQRRMTYSVASPWYEGDPADLNIGWFGHADDNAYFDLD